MVVHPCTAPQQSWIQGGGVQGLHEGRDRLQEVPSWKVKGRQGAVPEGGQVQGQGQVKGLEGSQRQAEWKGGVEGRAAVEALQACVRQIQPCTHKRLPNNSELDLFNKGELNQGREGQTGTWGGWAGSIDGREGENGEEGGEVGQGPLLAVVLVAVGEHAALNAHLPPSAETQVGGMGETNDLI